MLCTSFNKKALTIVIGKVASDPAYKEADEGGKAAVAEFTIYDSAIGENGKEILHYYRICAFGNQASLARKHISKGDLCCIEGRLSSRVCEDNGKEKAVIEAERIMFLAGGSKQKRKSRKTQTDDAGNS